MDEHQAKLRAKALEKLEVVFDPDYPEVIISWNGNPVVMLRSFSFGAEPDCLDTTAPGEGRVAIHSWDNDGGGDWTGNIKEGALWETALTWPPEEVEEVEEVEDDWDVA